MLVWLLGLVLLAILVRPWLPQHCVVLLRLLAEAGANGGHLPLFVLASSLLGIFCGLVVLGALLLGYRMLLRLHGRVFLRLRHVAVRVRGERAHLL